MLKKLIIFILIMLPVFSMRAQRKELHTVPETALTEQKGINRTALIDFAKQYLGTPYRRGSANPKTGFDCSGFVSYVFKKFDVSLPRSSKQYKPLGKALKPEEFKVGDIIVFYGFKDASHIGHVGIICEANGMKSRFIHASSGKAHSVTISDLGSVMYNRRFYKCIDVAN
jgi:cell wall-associated NlpC family hydrolase